MMNSLSPFLLILILTVTTPMTAQQTDETNDNGTSKSHFSITAGAAAGNFAITAPNFLSVYSHRDISKIYFAGIGTNSLYLIGKYREYTASGTSRVVNIGVTGKAEWSQKFYAAGLRLRPAGQALYADLLYVVTRAEESITTVDPVVSELTTRYETENKGAGLSLGLAFDVIGPLGFFVEGEYSIMLRKGENPGGKIDPELGGACVSAGVHFAL